jgi:predicted acylesterase/phospholipase RssA
MITHDLKNQTATGVMHRIQSPRSGIKSPDTLVISGGGVKGVAMLGAVSRLHTAGMLSGVKTVVGTSAGAIVGAMVATRRDFSQALETICTHGYTPDFDFDRLSKEFGLDSGKSISSLAGALLQDARDATLGDIWRDYGVRLVVCVTNLTRRRAEYLSPDTHPSMPVLLALRMSCSVPLYFGAVPYAGDWYVDGGLVDAFPCEWATNQPFVKCVIGVSSRPATSVIKTFEGFMGAVVECAAASCQRPPRADILDIELPSNVSSLNFGAPRDELTALFVTGVEQADAFLKKRL